MKLFTVIAAMLFSLAFGQIAVADLKVAYVDGQAVLNDSAAGKRERGKIEDFFKKKKAELQKEEKKLASMKKKFDKDKLTMSKSQSEKWQIDFRDKVQGFQKKTQDAQREVQQKEREFSRKAAAEIQKIVDAIAKEKKVNLVLEKNRSGLVFADASMDITPEVMKRFDKKFKR
ncbi:MAG: OmpH family outer membrane protein [Proteobacteria bacterium]|nr:OmpH family outer membrane protein [Pseudomonadota bacterium]